ncbi:MAG: carboxypeptidase-like regulatory domain-containing protein [Flavobacteriaceae bacterium]|jgi:hypothetical protein|nr:carboxypeptidase-like regulatory domain-containing protein [Flavobacteriaceae bacterium]
MKIRFGILFFLLFLGLKSQNIRGIVSDENGFAISNVLVININSEAKTYTDFFGNFNISAKTGDEIRFVKENYERSFTKINLDFYTPLSIILTPKPIEIAEVEIKFNPTGILKKDVKTLDVPEKIAALNAEARSWSKEKQTEVLPQNKIPKDFAPKDFNEGQVNLMNLAGALYQIVKKVSTPEPVTPNYADRQKFFRRLKEEIDLQYFKNYGLDDYDIDIFFAFVDERYDLVKKYHRKFNKIEIENQLKMALKEYMKTFKKV